MIRLQTLGTVELRDVDGCEILSVLAQPKRLALLVYLAIARPAGFHRRDVLLAMFWPETSGERGRAALSQALYFLRRSLGPGVIETRGNEEIGVDHARLWCDAVAFREARDRDASGEAMDLYRGDLMPGFHLPEAREWGEWLDTERRALRGRAAEAAWSLGEAAAEAGDAVEAVAWGRRAAELAPADEGQLRRLITLLDRVGDRAAALSVYEQTAERFAEAYGIRPSPETDALAAALRSPASEGATEEGESRDRDSGALLHAPNGVGGTAPGPASVAAGHAVARVEAPRGWLRAGPRGALVAAVVVTLIAVVFLARSVIPVPGSADDPSNTGVGGPLTVAVLPFDDFTPGPDDRYLADGTTEEVIARLSKLGGLRVTARTSVTPYRGTSKDTGTIGAELGVGSLVLGSVRTADERVRITVSAVEVESGTTLWTRQFEDDMTNLLDLQGRVAEAVATALGVRIRGHERLRLTRRGTENHEAHRLYLLGRESLARSEPEGFRSAAEYLTRAVGEDPGYAGAWASLADAYDHLAGMNLMPAQEAYPLSRQAARRALDLDPESARAHAALAMTLSYYYWDSNRAEDHFRRAITLDPSLARAHRTYAGHLRNLGRFDEARARARTAVELDPLDVYANLELVIIAYVSGRPDEAIAEARHLAGRGPEYRYAWFTAALAYAIQERFDDALVALDAADPAEALRDPLALRGYVHASRGEVAPARQILSALEESGAGFEFGRALVHLGLGETDRSLDLLEEAAVRRDWRLRLLGVEPLFRPLHQHPRFVRLVERVGLDVVSR